MEELFRILYWIAIVSMSIILVVVNAGILIISIRFMQQRKIGLGIGSAIFSIFCFYLIVIMLGKTFPGLF
ncbi:hypothetical protein [Paenibacillus agilis]|uniref:Uncharacterized protein n=1 Tax=Paenibacillus agilis TaxID=3020863 RepID=A0A559IHM7_9BACL|nr:hypothetical protein [Paenibacillus agilis]TVX87121.1 hypothetical protein FPZ44_21760 [Paenibacillus agilis]